MKEIPEGNRWCGDIETLNAKVFTYSVVSYDTDNKIVFEISRRKNEFKDLKRFIQNHIDYHITFNGIDFDDIVLNWLVNQKFYTLTGEEIAEKIYQCAQCLIDDNYDRKKPYTKYKYNVPFVQIDSYRFWSKMLRLSKKLSLKSFAVNLDLIVKEMPIHHSVEYITDEQIDEVISYNLNDVDVTKALAIELREEINLRVAIQKEFGLDCLSWDAIKIGSEALLDFYCKDVYYNSKAIKDIITYEGYKSEIKNYKAIEPELLYFKNILPQVEFKTDFFKKVYYDMKVSVNTYRQDYIYINPNGSRVKLAYGIGGLHSVNSNEAYHTDNFPDARIMTADAQSLYPNLYSIYGYFNERFRDTLVKQVVQIKNDRVVAKKAKNKVKDKFYKLILNGVSGLLQNDYSWLKSTKSAIAMRLHGQLFLSRLIEEFGLAGLNILSTNTDGVELIVPNNKIEEYNNALRLIEQEFGLVLEEEEYEFINYKTVNDYIAKTVNGKVKCKGEFVWQDEARPGKKLLDASNEFLVIAKAVEEYFVNHIPVMEFICNHQNIYDFTSAKKVDKSFEVVYRGEVQQQLNRYFVSTRKEGAYLYKRKKIVSSKKKVAENQYNMFATEIVQPKGNLENVLKDLPVVLLNEQADKPISEYPIDYFWYINKAEQQINVFESNQLKLV